MGYSMSFRVKKPQEDQASNAEEIEITLITENPVCNPDVPFSSEHLIEPVRRYEAINKLLNKLIDSGILTYYSQIENGHIFTHDTVINRDKETGLPISWQFNEEFVSSLEHDHTTNSVRTLEDMLRKVCRAHNYDVPAEILPEYNPLKLLRNWILFPRRKHSNTELLSEVLPPEPEQRNRFNM